MWNLKKTINETYGWIPIFTPEECDQIIKIGLGGELLTGELLNSDTNISVRKGNVVWLEPSNTEFHWIYQKCTSAILHMNERFFKFDLLYIEDLQFSVYDTLGDHYRKHVDYGYSDSASTRKLTFSIQLSEPSSYEGGELLLYMMDDPTPVNKDLGIMNLFPSYTLHEVTPITVGKRYSLVGWVHGPKFK
jgi:PKHD-type hydroxylase